MIPFVRFSHFMRPTLHWLTQFAVCISTHVRSLLRLLRIIGWKGWYPEYHTDLRVRICLETVNWIAMSCSWCSMRQIADADKDWITYLMSAITAENCSGDVACGDVETNHTKYSCWSRQPGRFELAIYILMCLLYCFKRLPDTSSHHKGSMITYNSLLPARWRSSFGILGTFVPAA